VTVNLNNLGLTIVELRVFISSSNMPTRQQVNTMSSNVFPGSSSVTLGRVCGTTQFISVALVLRDSGGDQFRAWAVDSGDLPNGVGFSNFQGDNFAGFFTVKFCPCQGPPPPPRCCNQNLQFKCPAGVCSGSNCPGIGPLVTCPLSNPDNNCYCGQVAGGSIACLAQRPGGCPAVGSPNEGRCNKNNDCPIGSLCQIQTCCGGRNLCIPRCASANNCQNP